MTALLWALWISTATTAPVAYFQSHEGCEKARAEAIVTFPISKSNASCIQADYRAPRLP
jgi:hypothetical protein